MLNKICLYYSKQVKYCLYRYPVDSDLWYLRPHSEHQWSLIVIERSEQSSTRDEGWKGTFRDVIYWSQTQQNKINNIIIQINLCFHRYYYASQTAYNTLLGSQLWRRTKGNFTSCKSVQLEHLDCYKLARAVNTNKLLSCANSEKMLLLNYKVPAYHHSAASVRDDGGRCPVTPECGGKVPTQLLRGHVVGWDISPFIGLGLDESTDRSMEKHLQSVRIADGKAVTVVDAVKVVAATYKFGMGKVVGFGNDGASMMASNLNGVIGLLTKDNPHLVFIQCVCHRLNLAVSHACAGIADMAALQSVLAAVYSFIQLSPTWLERFKKMAAVLAVDALKFKHRARHWLCARWLACIF